MNVPKLMSPDLIVPPDSVYNVHILNDNFNIEKTIIFSRGREDTNTKRPGTIISTQQIHIDDNIQCIKKKILAELWNIKEEWVIDEMYLFANARGKTTLQRIYDYINDIGADGITYEQLTDIADALGVDLHSNLIASYINYSSLSDEKTFTFSEFFKIMQLAYPEEDLHKYNISIPVILGQRFLKSTDYKLAILPSKITSSHVQKIKSKWQREKNEMISFNTDLLLNYDDIPQNDIYLCRAVSILKNINEESETACIQIYFPQLFIQEINTLDDLNTKYEELRLKTKELLNERSFQLYDNIQLLYDTYYGRTSEIDYEDKHAYHGIREFHLKIETDFHNKLPLELVFKNLHSTKTIPFIQFNPGHKRENIYRIYYEKYSRDGRKIPYLDDKKVLRFARRSGKSKNISMYILHTHTDKQETNLHLYFEKDGYLSIMNDFKQVYSSKELTIILRNALNPLFKTLNVFLQSIGLFIRPFYSLDDPWVDIINIKYITHIPINSNLNLTKNLSCIYGIMDKAERPANYEPKPRFGNDTFWKYKRVENYREMDQIFSFIYSEKKKFTENYEIISLLNEQFNLSEEDSTKYLKKFLIEQQILEGKPTENPGFMVVFREGQLENILEVEISEISSIKYLLPIQIYIDSIIRLTQYPEDSTVVTREHIQKICSKSKELKNADTNIQPIHKVAKPAKTSDSEDMGSPNIDNEEGDEEDLIFISDDENDIVNKATEINYIHSSDDNDSDDDIMFFDDSDDDSSQYGTGLSEVGDTPNEILFHHDSQNGTGIQNKKDEDDEFDEEAFQHNPDGAKIPFLRKMQTRDPDLFLASKEGKYKAYATTCQAKSQPVILTDKEKKDIDEKNPGSYHHAVRYGSTEKNAHWYICPRFWCFKTNRSISEEDVKAGKCGKIIPYGSQTIPKGHYVYEFKRDGENDPYVEHNPGFMTGKHPKNLCLPCCYKNFDTEAQRKKREQCKMLPEGEEAKNVAVKKEKEPAGTTSKYIISLDTYPLPIGRWGFLPVPMQLFLNFNYDSALEKKTSSTILPNTPVFLRYGVEASENQSFLAVMADIFSFNYNMAKFPAIRISDFKKKIIQVLSLNKFMQLHNAELITVFQPNEPAPSISVSLLESKYMLKLTERDKKSKAKLELYSRAVAAFENFKLFLLSESNIIDHTYMWELFTDNIIFPIGYNLILLNIVSNDMTDNIQLICPSSGFSNKNIFDDKKPTIIVLKHDNYYEPIYLYENTGKEVRERHAFVSNDLNKNIKTMLNNIKKTTNQYCARLPSLPRIHKFETPAGLGDILKMAHVNNYVPVKQVMNYNGKIIGVCFLVKYYHNLKTHLPIYIPCFPSSPINKDYNPLVTIKDIETVMADDIDEYASDYETTRDQLLSLHNNVLRPYNKTDSIKGLTIHFKVLENGIVIGFLTGTNQFVPIHPVSENIHLDNIPEKTFDYGEKVYSIDKDLTSREEDTERIVMTKKIHLETQFYNIFRNRIRKLLNDPHAISTNRQIMSIINNNSYTYYQKLEMIEQILRNLSEKHIIFVDIDDDVLMDLNKINDCYLESNPSPYCIYKDNEIPQLAIPSHHLLSGHDNEEIYFGRLSDDLVRNERVRLFMMNSRRYLNIQQDEYVINNDEFLIIHSLLLDKDYFDNLKEFNYAKEITTTGYTTAAPSIHQPYSNVPIKLYENSDKLEEDDIRRLTNSDCVKGTIPIIGNERQSRWKKIFPDTAKEIVFHNTEECSFSILNYILEKEYPEFSRKMDSAYVKELPVTVFIKQLIWKGYSRFLKTEKSIEENLPKIIKILKQQGKHKIMLQVERGVVEFDTVIMSESYFLTDLDIWMVADSLDLPIIVFNPNSIKGFDGLEWVLMGGKQLRKTGEKIDRQFYFIRTKITSELNNIANYNLITPSFKLDELPMMYGMVMKGLRKPSPEFFKNVQSIEEFLDEYI